MRHGKSDTAVHDSLHKSIFLQGPFGRSMNSPADKASKIRTARKDKTP
ncbi:hypothetical protein C8J31_107210 [Rhizobium sp. PP-CC-2G-626]|nr:hypothetical protein C8J31_107210 [Rhizobium sp. PP-CC-2G-626]